MTVQSTPDPADVERVVGRLLTDMAATAGLQGDTPRHPDRLWMAVAGAGPLTAGEVAERADMAPPYAREWPRHQAVSGYLDNDRRPSGSSCWTRWPRLLFAAYAPDEPVRWHP